MLQIPAFPQRPPPESLGLPAIGITQAHGLHSVRPDAWVKEGLREAGFFQLLHGQLEGGLKG